MVSASRGITYTLSQVYYGDEKNGIKPNTLFVQEMEKYPEWWAMMQAIEGLVRGVGIHAGGVVIVDEPFTNHNSIMKTPDGEIISQFELHDLEDLGQIKIDLLAVEGADKIRTTLDLLIKYGYVEKKDTLRETYESVIGVYNLEREAPEMWDMLHKNKIVSLFQMEQESGIRGIALTKPTSVEDLATLNSVIRLMSSEKGAETPLEKYARFHNNKREWYEEMDYYGLNLSEKKLIEKHLDASCGICESQEGMMSLLLEPEIAGWSLGKVDVVRKAVAKKNPKDFERMQEEFFQNAKEKKLSEKLTNYVWNVLVKTQQGYSFNLSHTLAYSIIGLQEMNLAYKYPIIFWNTANLIVDSGSAENALDDVEQNSDDEEDEDGNEEEENEDEGTKKNKAVNYKKISIAIGKMKSRGINIRLPDINLSSYTFTPDVETNTIFYGIKGITRIGDKIVQQIIANRPYESVKDFLSKVKVNKIQITELIKAGCFDLVENKSRQEIMHSYIDSICEYKKRLTLQNVPSLIKDNLLPEEMAFFKSLFQFNKYIKKNKKDATFYNIDEDSYNFLLLNYPSLKLSLDDEGKMVIPIKEWDKTYKKGMEPLRDFLKDPANNMLDIVNQNEYEKNSAKYSMRNEPAGEMESVGFYSDKHELEQFYQYGEIGGIPLSQFHDLPEEPVVVSTFKSKNGVEIPIFQLDHIAGTVIGKDKLKHTITLLCDKDVVNVKVWDAQFTKYDKQISIKNPETGKKKVIEKSWFTRGNKLIITGIRREDNFIPKIYKKSDVSSPFLLICNDGSIRSERENDWDS